MSATTPVSLPDLIWLLRCPVCCSGLLATANGSSLNCQAAACAATFPLVDGVPILLNETRSLFSIEDLSKSHKPQPSNSRPKSGFLEKLTPGLSRNIAGASNYSKFVQLLLSTAQSPRVLVVGGKTVGEGFDMVLSHAPPLQIVETDVVFGPRTMILCDGHDLPFQDALFDGVVIQAVLEHVVDPHRCVEEIHRVLRPSGIVYAETPFIQQVHEGRFDFTRFTHLGHRRLFRRFDEIESGAACGTGMALAWSYRYFLLSLSDSRIMRSLFDTFAKLTAFYLKFFDSLTIKNGGSFDAASAYYFIGRRSDAVLSDRELIRQYRGRI